MDCKQVDSPPADSDGVATAPPHEIVSSPANSDGVATAPPLEVACPPVNSDDMATDMEDTLEMICIHCNARIHPREEHQPTEMTYAVSAMFCATLLLWPAVVVPFCCKWFYKTLLFCPKCHAWLGKL